MGAVLRSRLARWPLRSELASGEGVMLKASSRPHPGVRTMPSTVAVPSSTPPGPTGVHQWPTATYWSSCEGLGVSIGAVDFATSGSVGSVVAGTDALHTDMFVPGDTFSSVKVAPGPQAGAVASVSASATVNYCFSADSSAVVRVSTMPASQVALGLLQADELVGDEEVGVLRERHAVGAVVDYAIRGDVSGQGGTAVEGAVDVGRGAFGTEGARISGSVGPSAEGHGGAGTPGRDRRPRRRGPSCDGSASGRRR